MTLSVRLNESYDLPEELEVLVNVYDSTLTRRINFERAAGAVVRLFDRWLHEAPQDARQQALLAKLDDDSAPTLQRDSVALQQLYKENAGVASALSLGGAPPSSVPSSRPTPPSGDARDRLYAQPPTRVKLRVSVKTKRAASLLESLQTLAPDKSIEAILADTYQGVVQRFRETRLPATDFDHPFVRKIVVHAPLEGGKDSEWRAVALVG